MGCKKAASPYSPVTSPHYGCVWFGCSLDLLHVTLRNVRGQDGWHVLFCLYNDFVFIFCNVSFAPGLRLYSKILVEDRLKVPKFWIEEWYSLSTNIPYICTGIKANMPFLILN
eukprot:5880407-Pleurochrysis_carterae.AAC.1